MAMGTAVVGGARSPVPDAALRASFALTVVMRTAGLTLGLRAKFFLLFLAATSLIVSSFFIRLDYCKPPHHLGKTRIIVFVDRILGILVSSDLAAKVNQTLLEVLDLALELRNVGNNLFLLKGVLVQFGAQPQQLPSGPLMLRVASLGVNQCSPVLEDLVTRFRGLPEKFLDICSPFSVLRLSLGNLVSGLGHVLESY
jgi:hypothetical protein